MTFGGRFVVVRSLWKHESVMNAVYPFGVMLYVSRLQSAHDAIEVRSINPVIELCCQEEYLAPDVDGSSMGRIVSVCC
tara:strand:+ start:361 stop:594 length:234 start_codon:yes stop_codon:yes gene_type:complete